MNDYIQQLIDSEDFDEIFKACMDESSKIIDIKHQQAEAERYLKLAQQWLGANNTSRAEKFAQKSLQLHDTKDIRQFLDKLKQVQSIEQQQTDSDEMQIEEENEEKNDIPVVQPIQQQSISQVEKQEIRPPTFCDIHRLFVLCFLSCICLNCNFL